MSFTIVCDDCDGKNVEIEENYMESYGEDYSIESTYMGFTFVCKDCGQTE